MLENVFFELDCDFVGVFQKSFLQTFRKNVPKTYISTDIVRLMLCTSNIEERHKLYLLNDRPLYRVVKFLHEFKSIRLTSKTKNPFKYMFYESIYRFPKPTTMLQAFRRYPTQPEYLFFNGNYVPRDATILDTIKNLYEDKRISNRLIYCISDRE